jgi:UDP-N-acetylglucosamine 1-carboxyvinyltransferase
MNGMRIHVTGSAPLTGVYRPSGNANAAQALLAAALMTEDTVILHHFPRTRSTHAMQLAAQSLGAVIDDVGENTIVINSAQIMRRPLTQTETDATIGIILLAAPLLARRRYARVEIDFPLNRIRTHLEALRDLGLDVVTRDGAVEITGIGWERRDIILIQASVTATALTMLLAASLGKETIVRNAACEPHIEDLADALNQMGAVVEGAGSNRLHIFGTEHLTGAELTIPSDHIETASVAAIAAMTGGRLTIEGCRSADLRMIRKIYAGLGIQFDVDQFALHVPHHEVLTISNREEDVDSSVETAPWPGFPSDLVAVTTVAATQARGTSLIHEKLYNNRLLFVDKLKAMGAQIVLCDPHRAIVVGPSPLRGIYMDSPDVRTGLGMLAAALVAQGVSVIDNAQALEHTFAGVIAKLQAVNAQIVVES